MLSRTGFPDGSVVNNLLTSAGDVGSIPGLERSPGGGNGNPLQYSPVFLLEKISWMEDPDKLQSI